jgi:NAD(P)-dependent dehydrogenase (short-subunit alcohol dehydrogenase family)
LNPVVIEQHPHFTGCNWIGSQIQKTTSAMGREKIILVTGGNRGIGKDIVRQLAERGHTVLLGSRSLTKGALAVESMKGKIMPVALDLNNPDHIQQVAQRIEEEFGHLDALVNNAGILSDKSGPAIQATSEVRRVLETNFLGVYELTQSLLPLLKKAPEGRIVNMSSDMGARANLSPDHAAYRLSKNLLNNYTIMLAAELRDSSVKVNSMSPGWVRSDMGGENAARSVEKGAETAVWLVTEEKIPSGKFFRDKQEIEW